MKIFKKSQARLKARLEEKKKREKAEEKSKTDYARLGFHEPIDR